MTSLILLVVRVVALLFLFLVCAVSASTTLLLVERALPAHSDGTSSETKENEEKRERGLSWCRCAMARAVLCEVLYLRVNTTGDVEVFSADDDMCFYVGGERWRFNVALRSLSLGRTPNWPR